MTGWLTRNIVILVCKTQGIGSCPVRGFDQEKLAEKLDLKDIERPRKKTETGEEMEKKYLR